MAKAKNLNFDVIVEHIASYWRVVDQYFFYVKQAKIEQKSYVSY